MSTLSIELGGGSNWVLPGNRVQGTVSWQVEEEPEAVELRLFWFTRGKGTEEAEVIDQLRLARPGLDGERSFAFTLPEGPYSFSGTLISLVWALELVVLPGGESQLEELVVAPTPVEVTIGTLREL
jgi:hypothetical protein